MVGHFVSDKSVNHETENALTALLLGIAVGLGKRVFVLQELPMAKPMIDLGGVLKTYTTRNELESALASRLAEWQKHAEAAQVNETKQAQIAISQRGALELGQAAAEYDELLLRAYYEAGYTTWATSGKKFLIVGTKGSGKSAIYRYAENLVQPGKRVHRLFYEFTDVEVQQLFDLADSWKDAVAADLLFRTFWRFNMVVDLVDAAFPADDPTLQYDDDVRTVTEWRSRLGIEESSDFYSRFVRYLKAGPTSPVTSAELVNARFGAAENMLRSALHGHEAFIYADRLDEGWDHGTHYSRKLLRAFVHECFLFKHAMSESIKPVLFLRSDIIDQLKQGLQEADKWDVGYLRWTRSQLRALLERRIVASQEQSDQEVDWSAILPFDTRGQDSVSYLLDRTFLRPRDAIQLMQTVVEQAQADGGLPARADSTLRGLSLFAKNRLLNLSLELSATHPGLSVVVDDLLEIFPQATKTRVSFVEAKCRSIAAGRFISWLEGDPMRALYDAGILVFEDSEHKLVWCEDISYERAIQLCLVNKFEDKVDRKGLLRILGPKTVKSNEALVQLHPALHGLLEVLSDPVRFRGRGSE